MRWFGWGAGSLAAALVIPGGAFVRESQPFAAAIHTCMGFCSGGADGWNLHLGIGK